MAKESRKGHPSEGSLLPPSGRQYEIRWRTHVAIVTEVGAALRSYTVDGLDLIDGFPLDERASGGRGQVLAPWPNRLADGQFTFDEQPCRAALDEPQRSNAIHGLVRWMPWHVHHHDDHTVSLTCVLHPQPGYLWSLQLTVTYRLDESGLTVSAHARNSSAIRAPFGIGFHPYLTVGTPTVDTTRLLVPARQRIVTDARFLPVNEVAVADTDFDFTVEREIGSMQLDTGYTDLVRGDGGRATVHLRSPNGARSVSLWVDEEYRFLMVYTGDTLALSEQRRKAVAVEPMTCPPDALNSGTDVIVLDPEDSWQGAWGITVDG